MAIFLRILAVFYVIGALRHIGHILGFGEMPWLDSWLSWQISDVVYGTLSVIAAIGLFQQKAWGVAAFLFIAFSQIILFGLLPGLFAFKAAHWTWLQIMIGAHIVSLAIYFTLRVMQRRAA